ncbi:MAG: hypothetical protein ACP5PT_00865 [Brevinematia bacterium]
MSSVGKFLFGSAPKASQQISPFSYQGASVLDELNRIYNTSALQNIASKYSFLSTEDLVKMFTEDKAPAFFDTSKKIGEDLLSKSDEIYNQVKNTDNLIQNQLSKTNTSLSLAGLLNTGAVQRTQSDIISNINFEKSKLLSGLLDQRAALSRVPYELDTAKAGTFSTFIATLEGAKNYGLSTEFLPFDTRMKIAQGYFGVPVDTVVTGGQSGLLTPILSAVAGGLAQGYASRPAKSSNSGGTH